MNDRWEKRMIIKERPAYTSYTPVWTCPKCRKDYDPACCKDFNYCPNCGENLTGGNEND